jgi:hypothetical protein
VARVVLIFAALGGRVSEVDPRVVAENDDL